jgi:hypothetical protein
MGQSELQHLPEHTIGFVALGTPFRGTPMQPLARFLAWVLAPFHSHAGIIEDLGYDNVRLRDSVQSLCSLRDDLKLPTHCFSEQFKTDYGRRFGLSGWVQGMVSFGLPDQGSR